MHYMQNDQSSSNFKYFFVEFVINNSMQTYTFSLKWMLLNKDWVDLQAIIVFQQNHIFNL